jgi:hypothetical protein
MRAVIKFNTSTVFQERLVYDRTNRQTTNIKMGIQNKVYVTSIKHKF